MNETNLHTLSELDRINHWRFIQFLERNIGAANGLTLLE